MRWLRPLSAFATALAVAAVLGAVAMVHPDTPLPDHWNPLRPLDISAPPTPVTRLKLPRAQSGAACRAALGTGAVRFAPMPDLAVSGTCHIRDRVLLSGLGGAALDPLETRCATALRLALWQRHGLEPAARAAFGTGIARIHHLSSYNCRPLRTPSGSFGRMSTHATADAVDITGVTLADGRRVTLLGGWGSGPEGAFLEAARDSACTWFATALGPDYNALHADHFHLQTRGWGLCR